MIIVLRRPRPKVKHQKKAYKPLDSQTLEHEKNPNNGLAQPSYFTDEIIKSGKIKFAKKKNTHLSMAKEWPLILGNYLENSCFLFPDLRQERMWITSHNQQPPGRGQETSQPFYE